MKCLCKFGKLLGAVIGLAAGVFFIQGGTAYAYNPEGVIAGGIYVGDQCLEGMTFEQADAAVKEMAQEYLNGEITLVYDAEHSVTVSAGDLGLCWTNEDLLNGVDAYAAGGNVVSRFKEKQDLLAENVNLKLTFAYDEAAVTTILEEQCTVFDCEKVEASLTRENGEFVIYEGTDGRILDVEASMLGLDDYIQQDWKGGSGEFALTVAVDERIWDADDLGEVTDLLGTYTTSYKSSGASRSGNIVNAADKCNGKTVYPGEEYSTKSYMVPFTTENGYREAHAYSGGRVIDSVGGGICQVSSTLYNAVLMAELEITCRKNHAMTVEYVPLSCDATISADSNIDFTWVNNTEYPVYVEMITTKKKQITVNIYGKETRPENRTIEYVSEVLEESHAEGEKIYGDGTKPAGYMTVTSPYTGYKAKLWKVVYVDGVETERIPVNESKYKATPRTATVGTATSNPVIANELNAAIWYGSIENMRYIVDRVNNGDFD